MQKNKKITYAFIDSQNLNLGVQSLGWKLDWKRFRVYLKDKYNVSMAYMFLGYIEGNNGLYRSLQAAGFILIFKPMLHYKNGKIKGNCDAELVLQAMIDFDDYNKAVIVSGDGDFYCLVRHLLKNNKLETVFVPDRYRYSSLLKKASGGHLSFVSDHKKKFEYKKKENSSGTSPQERSLS
ncbi:NYN domain-containing protein [Candidatus Falkowbacteria bacterium]|jgi:uncharacterized LabA/DUF88 family protein|nr:NYN domain-containing protein [Candidatus Falkowbacteria bacterium]MBT4433092.1 NYN domain-containing protein [Candidatus Falkowbacteria bacterium]